MNRKWFFSEQGGRDRGLGSLWRGCRGGGGHQYFSNRNKKHILQWKQIFLNQNLTFWHHFSLGGHRAVERVWDCRGKTYKLWLGESHFPKSQKIMKISGVAPSYRMPEYGDSAWQFQWGKQRQDVKQIHKESEIEVLSTKINKLVHILITFETGHRRRGWGGSRGKRGQGDQGEIFEIF